MKKHVTDGLKGSCIGLALAITGLATTTTATPQHADSANNPIAEAVQSSDMTQAPTMKAQAMKPKPGMNADVKANMEDSDIMTQTSSTTQWDTLLGTYVGAPDSETGLARFDYKALKASADDTKTLRDYIDDLEAMDPTIMDDAEAIAYWANLYNAVTIAQIIENYPVKSIRDIKSGLFTPGPWKKDIITVQGSKMSLDDVEHKTLRQKYPSPLIHYMVNCASVGCPNLKSSLWDADTLDADRDAAARAYINSPRGAVVTRKGLRVSQIYSWFKEDFGGNNAGVLEHLRDYADADLKAAIDGGAKIVGYDYDWSLNQ